MKIEYLASARDVMPFYLRLFILFGPCIGIWGVLYGQDFFVGAYAIYYLTFVTGLELSSYVMYKVFKIKMSRWLIPDHLKSSSESLSTLLLIVTSLLFFALWGAFFYRIIYFHNSTLELIALIVSMSIAYGSLCITIAHEFGHRKSIVLKLLSTILLLSCFYGHYNIEHNRGHHKNVGFRNDPATARKGEIVYAFWIRALIMGYMDAWKISYADHRGVFFIKNPMIWRSLIQLALMITCYFIFGTQVTVLWIGSAFLGICLLCSTNYIEHYGLTRQPEDRITASLSWDSNYYLERILLFELNYHADHHIATFKSFTQLAPQKGAPKLPGGYGYCLFISLIPPLWFKIMDKRIEQFHSNQNLS